MPAIEVNHWHDDACAQAFWDQHKAVPYDELLQDTTAWLLPQPGDRWRLNLNRTGGLTNRQSSSWSPIPTPKPAFHTPSAFGEVRFVER